MIAVLTYHALEAEPGPLSTPPGLFALQMRLLAERGVRVVSLAEAVARARAGEAGPAVALTFDDGLASVYRHAWPVLARHGYPATVFLVTGHAGGDSGWPSQPARVRRRPLLGWEAAREMAAAGIEMGSHTVSHPDLTRLSPDEARAELVASRMAIEDRLGVAVQALAYPYGRADAGVRAVAARHYRLGCGTRLGRLGPGSDPLWLPRLDACYLRRPPRFLDVVGGGSGAWLRARRLVRDARAGLARHLRESGPSA
jgi:peptidoglycan/xylan/chitin deacetylase (PgdA/CDA1 family)